MSEGEPGDVIAGRYRLIDHLGQGGMGSVWRAEHLTLHSEVAVKLLDPKISEVKVNDATIYNLNGSEYSLDYSGYYMRLSLKIGLP